MDPSSELDSLNVLPYQSLKAALHAVTVAYAKDLGMVRSRSTRQIPATPRQTSMGAGDPGRSSMRRR